MATAQPSRISEPTASSSASRWWRVVGGLSMNLALGSLYAWSVFVKPLQGAFKLTREDVSNVFALAVAIFAISFILAGRLQDKYGPFWVSVTGGLLVSLGFFMCSKATGVGSLFIWFSAIAGIGNGFGYATPIPVMAKWFPDRRGLAVGLAVAGYGGGSAIFAPLSLLYLMPHYGWRTTFMILGGIFLVMTMVGSFLLKNPPVGYRPAGWTPAPAAKAAGTTYEFRPGEVLRTPAFYFMWIAYALGTSAGLMVISQLAPFAATKGVTAAVGSTLFIIGAVGNASGRIFSGWLSDALGRLNALRLMIAISAIAMTILPHTGGIVTVPVFMYAMVFIVYWCYGTQLSVNASTTSDFWGTKNAGINYGLLFTAWGVAGIIGPKIGGRMFDIYKDYRVAFYIAAGLAVVALVCELIARRPHVPAAREPVRATA